MTSSAGSIGIEEEHAVIFKLEYGQVEKTFNSTALAAISHWILARFADD